MSMSFLLLPREACAYSCGRGVLRTTTCGALGCPAGRPEGKLAAAVAAAALILLEASDAIFSELARATGSELGTSSTDADVDSNDEAADSELLPQVDSRLDDGETIVVTYRGGGEAAAPA